ncbi:MAG TPA: tRNA pseudouridine(13) synthase TruD [Kofleriaceae bacterium]|nr:tRNA pseudouridine(13) synthase TruD [Kofleriaceae bacterium]
MTLPYLTSDLAGTAGVLRVTDDDFRVEEELPYAASGEGDHVFVRIEKRGLTSPAAAQALARALGVRERDIGIAGMKDRRAVTTQWMSLPPPVTPEQAMAVELADLRVLEAIRHPHKLRTGHVRANHFVLVVRGVVAGAAERARAILTALAAAPGAPNWYGEQRFGRDGDNAARGRAIVTGAQRLGRDRRMDRLMVSALQSQLFNDWLTARLADGLYRTALAGDVLHKIGGGMFTCDDPATDTARLAAGELVVTGPMFGDRMRPCAAQSPAAAREAEILARHGLTAAAFATVRAIAEGTRRDATIAVGAPRVTALDDATLEVAFTLPGGAYATTVMRELQKVPDAVPQNVDTPVDDGGQDA